MKLTFYTNFAKSFTKRTKSLFLFILSILVFNSCKKELLTDEKENLVLAQNGVASIKTIDYNDFLKKVNLNKIGKVGEMFRENPSGASVRVENSNTTGLALEIETNNIKELRVKGHVSYVFPIKLPSKYAQTFSNLTVDIKGDTVITFVTTYKPTLEWIKDWHLKKASVFTGEVDYALVGVNSEDKKETRALMNVQNHCIDWQEYYLIPNQCQGPPYHWPGDSSCELYGKPGGAYNSIGVITKTQCYYGGGGGGDPIGGGGGGTGEGGNTTPFPPSTYQPCGQPPSRPNPNVPPCEEPTLVEHLINNLQLGELEAQITYLNNPLRRVLVERLSDFLHLNGGSMDSQNYARWAIAYLMANQSSISINQFLTEFFPVGSELIADPNADNWTDPDNEILFDPDQTVYQQYQDNQPWPTVNRVIDFEKFVPLRQVMRADGQLRDVNCLVLAREQLGKVGYTCSGYLPGGQTFSIFTTQNGVNLVETKKAISYIISSLSRKIPVLIGVDNRHGAPSANLDNSTDHYVVIVGMGTDEKGKYFQFMDSATENRSTGASYNNRLYYDSVTGKITGKTAIVGYRSQPGMRDYTVTQVRKSIKK